MRGHIKQMVYVLQSIGWLFMSPVFMCAPRMFKKERFAFLVHPRNIEDFTRPYPVLRNVPKSIVEKAALFLWPYRVSTVIGLHTLRGKPIKGYIIGIPMMASQMLDDRKKAAQKVKKAVRLAEKLGCKIVGLGMFTSVVTAGGKDIAKDADCVITNGNTTTALMALEMTESMIKKRGACVRDITVAIVGASGSIGRGIADAISNNRYKKIILVGRNGERLRETEQAIMARGGTSSLAVSYDLNDVREAELVIVCTSAADALIKKEHLKKGAMVVDITQPRNTSPDLKETAGVTIVDAGLVETPHIRFRFNFGIKKEHAFACLAETLMLAASDAKEHMVGDVESDNISRMKELMRQCGFRFAQATSFGEATVRSEDAPALFRDNPL